MKGNEFYKSKSLFYFAIYFWSQMILKNKKNKFKKKKSGLICFFFNNLNGTCLPNN